VPTRRDQLVDVLDGDRLHLDEDLVRACHRVRELLVAGNSPDLVQYRCLHRAS
jgi:hypothetical protein